MKYIHFCFIVLVNTQKNSVYLLPVWNTFITSFFTQLFSLKHILFSL